MPESAFRTLISPRMLLLHAVGAAAVTAATLLGLWQYDAWQGARALAARDLVSGRPAPLTDVLGPDDPFPGDQVGRPVTLRGAWRPEGTVEVADRSLAGRDGRWLVTPVAVCDTDCAGASAVPVVRGWLARGAPLPPAPQGMVELTGWLQPGEGRGLPDADPRDDVLPELRIASLVQHVDADLYGGYVIAKVTRGSRIGEGLLPLTPAALPEPGTGPATSLRNLFYAAEWWVFAGFALFLWWRWARDELDRTSPGEAASPPESPPRPGTPGTPEAAEIASTP